MHGWLGHALDPSLHTTHPPQTPHTLYRQHTLSTDNTLSPQTSHTPRRHHTHASPARPGREAPPQSAG
eukprot:744353-Rhodomonas_salina.1